MAVTTSGERKDLTQSLAAVADFATQTHARALLVLLLVTFISIRRPTAMNRGSRKPPSK